MSIASKVTLVVTFLAGLLLAASGYAGLVLLQRQSLDGVRRQSVLMSEIIRGAAESDYADHGQLGAIADAISRRGARHVAFFDAAGRVVVPVPVEEQPVVDSRIRNVIERRRPREIVGGPPDAPTLVRRVPLFDNKGKVIGAFALRVDVEPISRLGRWLNRGALVAGVLLALFALLVGLYARGSIGRPITRLMVGMDHVIRGDLTHVLPLERNDEIGRIAYRFNEMTSRLRTAQEEVRRSAEARVQLQARLRRSEKLAAMGQLSAEIAHEVGTPLNVIGGRARALRRKADQPDAVQKNGQIIADQVTRITKIIQQVLDLARSTPRREDVRLDGIVDDAVAFLEDQLLQHAVRVERRIPDDLPVIEGDPDGLQQVVINLMLNALQAMPEGGVLTITIERTHRRKGGLDLAPPQSYIALSFADTGVGIPPTDLEHIFDPFFSTKAKGEGTGLGLTIVAGIVKEHDGRIDVEATPGEGSLFRVFLPEHDQEQEREHETDADPDTDTDADADADTDTDTDTDTDADTGADTDADADAKAHADSGSKASR